MISGPMADECIHVLYLTAISAEAMTAALVAGRREMDWVGVILLGCITALGGGSVRDILLDHHPLSWVEHPQYLLITASAALATVLVAPRMHHLRKLFLFLDAIGLVVFTVIGCAVAQSKDLSVIVVIIAGMITGCAGGVLRDVLVNEIPLLFRAELYATVSVITSGLYLLGMAVNLPQGPSALIAMAAGLVLRILAIRYHWNMPRFIYNKDWS